MKAKVKLTYELAVPVEADNTRTLYEWLHTVSIHDVARFIASNSMFPDNHYISEWIYKLDDIEPVQIYINEKLEMEKPHG